MKTKTIKRVDQLKPGEQFSFAACGNVYKYIGLDDFAPRFKFKEPGSGTLYAYLNDDDTVDCHTEKEETVKIDKLSEFYQIHGFWVDKEGDYHYKEP